jgi:pilus assembly protein CpaC
MQTSSMRRLIGLFFAIAVLAMTAGAALASDFHINAGETAIVRVYDVNRISIGNPDVLEARPVSREEVIISGKAEGFSSLIIWDRKGRFIHNVIVHAEKVAKTADLKRLIDIPSVKVALTDKALVLEGKVADPAEKARVLKIASAFSGNVVDLLQLANDSRIRVEALILELTKGKGKSLGLKYLDGRNGELESGSVNLGAVTGHLAFSWNGSASVPSSLGAIIDAVRNDSSSRILSWPSLTTQSGNKASIQAGGEIPVPVGVENNQVKIEWKPYGVILNTTPAITPDGRIALDLSAEVSELDWDNAITTSGITIPAIRSRKVENKLRLASGEPFIVGGLLDNKQSRSLRAIPLLEKIPLLGELFKSREFNDDKTELVIVIIPRIAPEGSSIVLPENLSADLVPMIQAKP